MMEDGRVGVGVDRRCVVVNGRSEDVVLTVCRACSLPELVEHTESSRFCASQSLAWMLNWIAAFK